MPAPSLIAAALIARVKKRAFASGARRPISNIPNRLAEEYAMLDVMSRGRLEVAFPLGTGMEYWANPVNPATARERHKESIEIILKAWTQDGPTSHYGDFYTYRFLNPWVRPLQRPASPLLHRRHRQPGNDRARRPTGLWLFGGVRHQEARAGTQQQSARAIGRLWPHAAARPIAARRHDLCRGDAGESRG